MLILCRLLDIYVEQRIKPELFVNVQKKLWINFIRIKSIAFFMKENPMIVPIQLTQSKLSESTSPNIHTSIPSCHFKMNGAEATFYNGLDKHLLHAVLAEMFKYAR